MIGSVSIIILVNIFISVICRFVCVSFGILGLSFIRTRLVEFFIVYPFYLSWNCYNGFLKSVFDCDDDDDDDLFFHPPSDWRTAL